MSDWADEKAREIVPPHHAFWNGRLRDYQAEVAQALQDAVASEQDRCIGAIVAALAGYSQYDGASYIAVKSIQEGGHV